MEVTTTRFTQNPCPLCGYLCDAATAVDPGDEPQEGSVSICFNCGDISIFGAGLILQKMTQEELLEIQLSDQWPKVEQIMMEIKLFRNFMWFKKNERAL